MYRDSSAVLGCRLKAVMDVLGGMNRGGSVTLSRSLERTSHLDCIPRAGAVHPVPADDLLRVLGGVCGLFYGVVQGLHRKLCEFVHRVVTLRRDEAVRGWTDHPC